MAKLSEKGLIEVTGAGARRRRQYGITDAGRAELRGRLTEPGTDLAFRSAALLRVFFLWTLSREEGVDHLKNFARVNRERPAALEAVRDKAEWVADPVRVCGWLILEYGLRGSATSAERADWAAERLAEHL
ncbi:PadR family transcriptional regulator [Streptomyces sp. NPDC086777]|uniref:PadR family transcriptional regulator n=1 Tax=Streptomyces sp. NPDC086777 TaxID=3154866 RepID=UPI00345035EE